MSANILIRTFVFIRIFVHKLNLIIIYHQICMRQSFLFTKTTKNIPKDEVSTNAQLLIRAGYVDKLMAGVYTFLPLGLTVLEKIKNIIREEMNAVDGQEVLMPALNPKENWTTTGRWDGLDVLFKLPGAGDKEYALGASHEEVVTPLVQQFAHSYKDLPISVYQIQNKFRNEARSKSGLLRGREFSMKDMYSFHASQEDLDKYYERVVEAYFKVFNRLGIGADVYLTYASGGTFSKYSHEFQLVNDAGEDTIYLCKKCHIAVNKEIIDEQPKCPKCNGELEENKGIEVGNIFKLATKYSEPFGFTYTDENGKIQPVIMGCYGMGPTRLLGSLVEVFHDENGLVWPKVVTPLQIHLVNLSKTTDFANKVYDELTKTGFTVLFDDREASAGEKLKDSDLLGLSVRLVISDKLGEGKIEYKERAKKEVEILDVKDIVKKLGEFYKS